MKPEKYTFYEFYVEPVIIFFKDLADGFLILFGYWFCDGCEKLHSPRIKNFKALGQTYTFKHEKEVCSKHKVKQ